MHGNSQLTPEVQEAICKGIRNGYPIEDVCDLVSIHPATFYRWMQAGKKAPANEVHARFREEVKKARAANRAWHIRNIKRHSKQTWQASAWFLERRNPENWARKETEELVLLRKEIAELKAKIGATS